MASLGQSFCASMGVMNPAHGIAMGFHCQTQCLTNSGRLISVVSPPFSLDAYYSTIRVTSHLTATMRRRLDGDKRPLLQLGKWGLVTVLWKQV